MGKLFRVLTVLVVLFTFSTAVSQAVDMVTDNNNGNAGDILVNTGVQSGTVPPHDVGTWTDPAFLKGKDGTNGSSTTRNQLFAGPGADVVLWQNPTQSVGVETQYRYDACNNNHQVYGVVKINLWQMINTKKETHVKQDRNQAAAVSSETSRESKP